MGPIGSGGVISSWLLHKPSISYGPPYLHEIGLRQERTVPEKPAPIFLLAKEHMRDANENDYDMDAGKILDLIHRALLARGLVERSLLRQSTG